LFESGLAAAFKKYGREFDKKKILEFIDRFR